MSEFTCDLIHNDEYASWERRKRKGSPIDLGRQINIIAAPPPGEQAMLGAAPMAPAKLRDNAISSYRNWHCKLVDNSDWKGGFHCSRDITLEVCLDLRRVYQDQGTEFFFSNGVKAGIARLCVEDVPTWPRSTNI
jgi:hypothetical protein